MNALVVAALIFASVWLVILTVGSALLVRQVALLSLRLDPDFALDGLNPGRRVPDELAARLPDGGGHILVLGAGCSPCRQLVQDLQADSVTEPIVVVIEGDRVLAVALAQQLPPSMDAITGPDAEKAYHDLDLQTTPFLFYVNRRKVVRKDVLRGAPHLLSLLERPEAGSPAQARSRTLELTNAG